MIGRSLIQAYLETHYVVSGAGIVLRIGERSPALAALHARRGADCSAFITACNPFSRVLDAVQNARRQDALAHVLRQRNLVFFEGVGRHPSGDWAEEPSFLVPGLPLDDARALGIAHEQNAIVWSGVDAVPRLIRLR